MHHRTMLEKIVTPNEMQEFLDCGDEELLSRFIKKRTCITLDWKQEDAENLLVDFLIWRSNIVLEQQIMLGESLSDFYKEHYKKRKNGDLLAFILRCYDCKLKEYNGRLLNLNFGDDQYRLFVVKARDAKNLKRIKTEFWKFSFVS